MATSGIVTFSVTRDQIITDAMLDCGALGVGETIVDDDLQFCARRLNMIVKQWSGTQDFAPGLKMWSRKRGNLFLSATTGTYSLGPAGNWGSTITQTSLTAAAANGATTITVASITGLSSGDNIAVVLDSGALNWTTINGAPSGSTVTLTAGLAGAAASSNVVYSYTVANQARRPLQIVTAVLRDQNQNDVPLYIMTLQDYESLPTKAQGSSSPTDPTGIYYEAQLTNGQLYTDAPAASDGNKYIHMVYLSPAEDFSAATDTPDYPQEWYLALVAGLSVNIAPGFSLPVTQDMRDNFKMALAVAQQANAETTSMFFRKGENDYAMWGNL